MATKFEVILSAKLSSDSAKQIQQQLNQISSGLSLKINADDSQVTQLTKSVSELSNTANDATESAGLLDGAIGKFLKWQVIGDVIHGVKDGISDMIDQVISLDDSLVELDKVTDLTSSGLQSLADDAFEVGEQIGATGWNKILARSV